MQDGKWIDTPFAVEAGKWHKVVIAIDVAARRWEFSVDGRVFKSSQPLPFRSAVDRLDTVRYQCENVAGIYIGAVRVLRPTETAAGDPYAGWQTVGATHEGLRFSLRIPPGWKWKEIGKGLQHHAVKQEGLDCTIFMAIDCTKLAGSKKKVTSEEAAKRELKQYLDIRNETERAKFVAKQVVKVGNVDAAWMGMRIQPAGQPPAQLEVACVLQTAGYMVHMEGVREDLRAKRTAKDFDDSLAEFLLIAQSFRVVGN